MIGKIMLAICHIHTTLPFHLPLSLQHLATFLHHVALPLDLPQAKFCLCKLRLEA